MTKVQEIFELLPLKEYKDNSGILYEIIYDKDQDKILMVITSPYKPQQVKDITKDVMKDL